MPQILKRLSRTAIVLMIMSSLCIAMPLQTVNASETDNMVQQEPGALTIGTDLLVVRPLGIVATVCGSMIYVLSLPFSITAGNSGEVYQKTVAEPAVFTFKRPLGHNM
jgi:hypothetical protein